MLLIVLAYMMPVHAVQRYSGRYLLSLNKGRAQVSILFPLYKDRTQAAILFPLYCREFYGIVYGCPDYIYFWIISLPGSYPFSDHIPIWMTAVLDHIHSWMISVSGLYTHRLYKNRHIEKKGPY